MKLLKNTYNRTNKTIFVAILVVAAGLVGYMLCDIGHTNKKSDQNNQVQTNTEGTKMILKNITQQAIDNTYYRHVLATGKHSQVVIMSIPVSEEVGEEVHQDNDQVLYLVSGNGKAILNGQEQSFEVGDAVLVPAGTRHNFINTGDEPMKIITIYSPSHHPDGTIHKTKAEADAADY